MKKYRKIIIPVLFTLLVSSLGAQDRNRELDQLIKIGLNNNRGLKAYAVKVDASKANINTAYSIDKTTIYYGRDQNNLAPNDRALNVLGVEQSFAFPTVYAAQRKVNKSLWEQDKAAYDIQKNNLILDISQVYEAIVYSKHKEKLYTQLDSLYSDFSHAGKRKFELGETNYLEKITAEAKSKQIHTTLIQIQKQKQGLLEQLKALLQSPEKVEIENNELDLLFFDESSIGRELQRQKFDAISSNYSSQLKLQNQNWFPDLNIELFTGTNKGLGYRQNGFQIGVSIPLFFNGNIAKKKAAKLEMQSWEDLRSDKEIQMESYYWQKQAELGEHKEMIKYYTENGKKLSKEIMKTADMSYRNGEIDFFQYIQSMESAIGIDVDYLDSVLAYNKSYLELYYFNFEKQ